MAPPTLPTPEFLNRELMWLAFNRRVLHEAIDERTPLLERVGYLSIFNSNLDEFFQKRVGGLKRQIAAGVTTLSPDGLSPQQQLAGIRQAILPMLDEQARCFTHDVKPLLAEHGIELLTWDQLTDAERAWANDYFQRNLFPVLTPLAVDPGHPFPFISNLSTSLGVMLRRPDGKVCLTRRREEAALAEDGQRLQFARVKVPYALPRWVRLEPASGSGADSKDEGGASGGGGGGGGGRFVALQQIIRSNLDKLFEGMEIVEVQPFRLTRNADVERDEEDADDLLGLIEQELRDRRFAQAVRLEVHTDPCHPMTRFLMRELNLGEADVYQMPDLLDYTSLGTIHDLNLPKFKFEPWTAAVPSRLRDQEADLFSIIRAGDVLSQHPYESFSASAERFIRAAASDPKVIAIKQTLYRTSMDSPFIPELIRAAEAGKQVVCLVELKARFDEERNVQLATLLEKAGVHVVYGLVGLKTHTKTSLVVRQEAGAVRTYAHISTGNYNSKTARLYTDLGLLTCDPRITNDLVRLFHYLTGHSIRRDFDHLLIAPTNMRRRFTDMIDREIAHAESWKRRGGDPDDLDRPHIIAKMNSLEDKDISRKLYEASAAGVRIELIVRGFCCLRPGVPGMSENISVISVIGRFLVHSRIYYFHNAGQSEYYIGSADWMYRNLNNRVECVTPVYDPAARVKLQRILDLMRSDQRQAWEMDCDGWYTQRQPESDEADACLGTHDRLMQLAGHAA